MYRVYKLKTKSVVVSRNVRWMSIMYGDFVKKKVTKNSESFILDLDDGIEDEDDSIAGRELSDAENAEKNQKVLRALKRLNTSYNPTLSALVTPNVAFVGAGYDDYENPVTFYNGWNYPIDEDKKMENCNL